MSIWMECSSCNSQFKLDDSLAGLKGKCGQCGAILQVPSLLQPGEDGLPRLADEDELPLAETASAPSAPGGPIVLELSPLSVDVARLARAKDDIVTDPTRSFWADAWLSFAIPFRARGRWILLIVLVWQLLLQLRNLSPVLWLPITAISIILSGLLTCWLYGLFLGTVAETCRGQDDLPSAIAEQPMSSVADIIRPIFLFIASVAWVWLPLSIYAIVYFWHGKVLGGTADLGLLAGLWALGVFLWPMTLLTIALHDLSFSPLRYDRQLLTIGQAFTQYLAIWPLLLLTLGMHLAILAILLPPGLISRVMLTATLPGPVQAVTAGLMIVLNILGWPLQTYLMLVSMRIIGLFYRHNKRHFAWVAE